MRKSRFNTLLRIYQWLLHGIGWLLFTTTYGQSEHQAIGWPPLQIIGVEQGLPQAFVSGVVQDDAGFIWVGTLGGVARYDGRQMLPFYHQPNNPASPRSNMVGWLERGGPNQIWLRYNTGQIDRMDAQTGHCQHFTQLEDSLRALPGDRQLHVDRQGNMWGLILHEGVFHYDVRQKRFTRYRRVANGLVSDTINTLAEDRQGNIWAISPIGISQIPASGQLVKSARFKALLPGLRAMAINDERVRAFVRPNGEIMINNQTHLLFINPRRMTTRSVAFATHKLSIDQPLLSQSTDGTVYLLAGGTLYQYKDGTGITELWHYRSLYGNRHGGLQETSLWLDRSGVLWMGANTKGLFRIDVAAARLKAYRYQKEFCTDALQTSLGINLSTFFKWPFDNPKTASSYYFRTKYDQQGQLWMGIGHELGYYSFQTRTFTQLPNLATTQSNVVTPDYLLRGIAITADKQVWALSSTGTLYRYDSSGRRWQTPFGKLDIEALDLVTDTDAFWATTMGDGLLRYDARTHRCRAIHFDRQPGNNTDESLLNLHQDVSHPDWLWIGSFRGLIGFNKRTGRYRRFTTAEGLPNNTVYSILPDRQGYLWLSTNRGLCRFHPVTHTTLNFGLSDGLPGEEFNRFHHLMLPDGRLAFGGVEGWVLFDPTQLRGDTTRPDVAITSLSINNQLADSTGRVTFLPQLFNTLTSLRLAHDQNYLTVGFTALNYHQPDRVTYRYTLEGYDNQWTTTTQASASYTQLPPGHYNLRIVAANTLGLPSQQVRQLAITILPPFWASSWAYGLYTLLVGSIGWGVFRMQRTRSRERQELALRERQAAELRQLDEAKTRFFTNVSHELRTPLTLMLGPLNSVLSRNRVEPQDEQFIRMADRSAQQLLELVNELLDLTRLEAGKLDLRPQTVELNWLLRECLDPFVGQAQQQGIILTMQLPKHNGLFVLIDATKLKRVIQNLLTNACKFTPMGGRVTLEAICHKDRLRIWVTDTGRGIDPKDLPHVFDRYFQTQQPGTPLEGGTGIGLALCQELVRLMQGTISVESEPGRGSSFCVDLPLIIDSGELTDENEPELNRVSMSESVRVDSTENEEIEFPYKQAAQVAEVDTVLIVEDNTELQTYLTTLLTPGLRVLTAANGQAALHRLVNLSQLPSLIIADIMMPIMDGFELLETLKAHSTYRMIPVIMLTARTEATDKLRALRLGVDDYLLKPFNESELTARVKNLLRNRRNRQVSTEDQPLEPGEDSSMISADEQLWLEKLEGLMAGRLGQFDLNADELADVLAMTRRTLYRTIKRLTGLTPAQYVAEARFQEARRLLETRQVSSVKQVAYRVGYRKVTYFSQVYQQRFGKNPTDYLK
ncbi:response regulator [Spirosoma sp. BT702]|uniref:histidine kinase n=1 Tax=Spirosoma profusum TaxID=2771354 RepID=A0A927G9X5_9BACT|nr:ATP-binding protein [Spirosoma profusum]MBD2705067.1 response regulator [Spirosoma profusum]